MKCEMALVDFCFLKPNCCTFQRLNLLNNYVYGSACHYARDGQQTRDMDIVVNKKYTCNNNKNLNGQ